MPRLAGTRPKTCIAAAALPSPSRVSVPSPATPMGTDPTSWTVGGEPYQCCPCAGFTVTSTPQGARIAQTPLDLFTFSLSSARRCRFVNRRCARRYSMRAQTSRPESACVDGSMPLALFRLGLDIESGLRDHCDPIRFPWSRVVNKPSCRPTAAWSSAYNAGSNTSLAVEGCCEGRCRMHLPPVCGSAATAPCGPRPPGTLPPRRRRHRFAVSR